MIGPREQWQQELEGVSKAGLILLAKSFFILYPMSPAERLKWVRDAKRDGRIVASNRSNARWVADPAGEYQRFKRKSAAAKKAARRRKREQRQKKA